LAVLRRHMLTPPCRGLVLPLLGLQRPGTRQFHADAQLHEQDGEPQAEPHADAETNTSGPSTDCWERDQRHSAELQRLPSCHRPAQPRKRKGKGRRWWHARARASPTQRGVLGGMGDEEETETEKRSEKRTRSSYHRQLPFSVYS